MGATLFSACPALPNLQGSSRKSSVLIDSITHLIHPEFCYQGYIILGFTIISKLNEHLFFSRKKWFPPGSLKPSIKSIALKTFGCQNEAVQFKTQKPGMESGILGFSPPTFVEIELDHLALCASVFSPVK
jgi:hypothetical protein